MTLNYVFAVVVWLVVLIVGLVITLPDVPVVPLLSVSVGVMVAVPLLMSPTSKSLWAAIEFLVLRADPDYVEPVAPRSSLTEELE